MYISLYFEYISLLFMYTRARKICSTTFFCAVCSLKKPKRWDGIAQCLNSSPFFRFVRVLALGFQVERNTRIGLLLTARYEQNRSLISYW